jgi:hypothetical protein
MIDDRRIQFFLPVPAISITYHLSCHCLQGCLPEGKEAIMGHLGDAGVIPALVTTLKHESPYCVAAAATALGYVWREERVGKKLMEVSGAMPALLSVVQGLPPPGDPDKQPGKFREYVPDIRLLCCAFRSFVG